MRLQNRKIVVAKLVVCVLRLSAQLPRPPGGGGGLGCGVLRRGFMGSVSHAARPLATKRAMYNPPGRRSMMTRTQLIAISLLTSLLPLSAQWKLNDKSIPRGKDGKPILTAPAPRRADGKPDLTGIWIADPPKLRDATAGLKPGEVSMTPWAEAIYNQRKDGALSAQDPDANCLPQGVPKIDATPLPFKIFQEPNVVVVLYEAFDQFRQFFMDGRELPKDPNPQWFGYSVAKWDGDTLVVQSSGFNGKAW